MSEVEARRFQIRKLIESAGSLIISVTFIKSDGSTRVMQVQNAATKTHVKGDLGSPTHRQGAVTRKMTHPELMPVYDIGSDHIKSINLDTVQQIKMNGLTYDFTI